MVTNTGQLPGTYTVVIHVVTATPGDPVNISPGAAQDVTLAAGESTTVTFRVGIIGNGTHTVTIDGVVDKLTVDSQI